MLEKTENSEEITQENELEKAQTENSKNNQTMARDTIIYMIAKIIEGVIGVVIISIMSYLYIPVEMGRYSQINVAVTTLAMTCIQWLTQSVFRYVYKYKEEDEKYAFYSTIFGSWLKMNVGVLLCAIILMFGFKNMLPQSFFENYSYDLLFSALVMFFTYNTYQLTISILAGMGKSAINLKLSIFNVCGKLASILMLNYIFGTDIIWVFASHIAIDFLTICIGMPKTEILSYINLKKFDKDIQKKLWFYGMPLTCNMVATSILNKSDIYVITHYWGEDKAGIYQTNYLIIASAFILISTGAMRGSYPTVLKAWNGGDEETAKKLLKVAIRNYLLVSVPAVVGVFLISDMIANSLFDELYWEGHNIMGFVAMGMMFLGITEYAIKPWELRSETKEIVKRSMISAICCSLPLNICFIGVLGYKFAGVSTAISFFVYFALAVIGTRKYLKFQVDIKSLVKILASSSVMGCLVYICKNFVPYNLIGVVIVVCVGVFGYGVTLFLTGEIKNEVNFIINKLKKRNV